MEDKFTRYSVEIPEIVRKAMVLAEELGFPLMPEGRPIGHTGPPSACMPEMGRLLSVLAAGYPDGTIAEFGTGAGVGTAWLGHGLAPGAKLFSAEVDGKLVTAVRGLFEGHGNVEIRLGDCFEVLSGEMPFDLIFMDSGMRDYLVKENWGEVVEMVRVGGKIVFDDLAPVELWPSEWDDLIDRKREFALHNPRVMGTEVRITPTQIAVIATRIE